MRQPSILVVLIAAASCGEPVQHPLESPTDPDAGALSCPVGTGYDETLGICVSPCGAPYAPVLPVLPPGTTLVFRSAGPAEASFVEASPVEVGIAAAEDASEPDEWRPGPELRLDCQPPCSVKVFARDPSCPDAPRFEQVYSLSESLAPAAGVAGSDAVARDDARIAGWANGWVEPIQFGSEVDAQWKDPQKALGPAQGDPLDVLALGNGGSAVLSFDPPFADGPGPDLAVFENAFNDTFLELGFVEVSSDGQHFARFDSLSLGAAPTASTVDPTTLEGLGGKYRAGFGTPFDLAWLRHHPLVTNGLVDVGSIRFVRIVDIVGDGGTLDSFGHPVYDPTPVTGSAGFDLDGVAALRSAAQ